MSVDIESIKRKLLIKYPVFGRTISNLEFQEDTNIKTAGTDAKRLLYNPNFLEKLSEKEQMALFAHEICHVAFDHIYRLEGKDRKLWNKATDAVINALLEQDGLPILKGGVDIKEAVNYDAETMYNKLLEEKEQNMKKQQSQNSDEKQKEQSSQEGEDKQDSEGEQGKQTPEESEDKQDSKGKQGEQNPQESENKQDSEGKQGEQTPEESEDKQDSKGKQGEQNPQESENKQDSEGKQGEQTPEESEDKQDSEGEKGEQTLEEGEDIQDSEGQQDQEVEDDSHSLWDKAIEERKKVEEKRQDMQEEKQNSQESYDEQENSQKEKTNMEKEDDEKDKDTLSDSENFQQGERETFEKNKQERRKKLQELSRELIEKASHDTENGTQNEGKKLTDIGIAAPLIDWRKLLRQSIKYDEEWSRKNARMRNGYFRHTIEQIPFPETEIVLDTSGSVSEILLKNFLRECKNILDNSKVKIGCFNDQFYGFSELKSTKDIDNMTFPRGGTNFQVAVNAFSRRATNKILFTDGLDAPMPEENGRNVIWVVFGDARIKPKGGRVIYITGEQLKKLNQPQHNDEKDMSR